MVKRGPGRPKKIVPIPDTNTTSRLSKADVLENWGNGLYKTNPELWIPHAIGETLDPWQAKIVRQLFLGEKHKVSIRAGHGSGKCKHIKDLAYLSNGKVVSFGSLIGKTFELLSVDKELNISKQTAFAEDNGIQPIWKVTTENGRRITVTGNHPLWYQPCVFTPARRPTWGNPEWREVKDLQVGNLICVVENLPVEGTMPVEDWKPKMLAYLIGDGCLIKDARFTQVPGKALDEVREIVGSLGLELKHYQRTSNEHDYAIVKSPGIRNVVLDLLREQNLLGGRSGDHFIPDLVWALPNEQLKLFLSRLFSMDGWAHSKKTTRKTGTESAVTEIGYVSKSERLVRDVHIACLRFGISGRIRSMVKKWTHNGVEKSNIYWEWSVHDSRMVIRFLDRIGIFGKEEACAQLLETARRETTLQRNAAPSRYATKWEGDEKRSVRWPYYGLPDGFRWEKIAAIEYVGEEPTVAVCVPGNETYLTDFVEHNSYLSSRITLQFLMNYIPSLIVATGPTGKQTRSQYWALLCTAIQKSVFKDDIESLATRVFVKGDLSKEEWKAVWVTSKEPRTIEGFHGPQEGRNLLWIVEEAKAVADPVFEALSGALSHEDNFLYISSTCGPPRGHFFDSHTKLRHLYDTSHVPSTQSSRVSPQQVQKWREQWGEDSPVFKARVLAEFPEEDESAIASLSWCLRAVENQTDDEMEAA